MSFEILHPGKILYKDSEISLFSRKGKLCVREKNEELVKLQLPGPFSKRHASCFKLLVRLFRFEPRLALKIKDNELLFSFLGGIYKLEKTNKWNINLQHLYRSGMNNPLSLVEIKKINGFENQIVYGEYWENKKKEEVSIWCGKNGEWKIIYTFPKKTITHIHNIVPDPNRECLYILTGDLDNESGIWVAKNNFRSVEPIVVGEQRYRSCIAFPVKEGLLFATDTPLEKNSISLLYLNESSWGEVKKLWTLNGSCIYGKKVLIDNKECYVFSTTVEGDSRKNGVKYLFSWKRGPGILSNRIDVVLLKDLNKIPLIIASFEKDYLPFIFQFGSVTFSSASEINDGEVFGTPIGVKHFDGVSMRFKFDGIS